MNKMLSRIMAAMGAGAFGQAVSILIQLASLPAFLLCWDTHRYGTWLILSAIPAYLSMADVGMVAAAGNLMTMSVAAGDSQKANRVFHSATVFMSLVCVLVSTLSGVVLATGLTGLPSDQAFALWLLILTVMVALFTGLSEAVFKATGRYAQGLMWGNLLRLVEWGGALLGLLLVGSFTAVAAGGLIARTSGLLWVMYKASQKTGGLGWGARHATVEGVRAMIKPAVSFMAFPMSNALTFQGATLLVGYLVGPTAVTVFNTARTVARLAVQVTAIFAHALWAEFSRMYGASDIGQLQRVYVHAIRMGVVSSVALSGLLYVSAPWLLSVWTHGRISFVPDLVGMLLVYAAVAGAWHVPRVLLMACNQHLNLANWALASAALMLALSYVFGVRWGMTGVALAMLLSELAMAAITYVLATDIFRLQKTTRVWAS